MNRDLEYTTPLECPACAKNAHIIGARADYKKH